MKPLRNTVNQATTGVVKPQILIRRGARKFILPAGVANFMFAPASPESPAPSSPPAPTSRPVEGSSGDEAMRAAVAEVQLLVGYTFRDPALLEEALTHSSHPDYRSYQRLELVGDAALTLAFTNYFFLTNPDLGPGPLSVLRAANISTEKLARVAVRHGLYGYLRRNSPKLDEMVENFTLQVMKEREEDCGGLPYGGSTLKAPKVLADIVESIAAAIYVDCSFNLELLWTVFRGLLEPFITTENLDEQPVTTLYEYCQKNGLSVDFKNWKRGTTNITNVFVDGKLAGVGSSEQKVIAKLNAARDALLKLPGIMQTDMEMDNPVIAVEEIEGSKQKLNDLCTKKHWPKPVYKIEKELGPAHDKRFICSVQVETPGNIFVMVGDLKSRVRDAENSVAAKLLYEMSNKNNAS